MGMSEQSSRPLRVFLCHSSNDKPVVRELYQKLRAEDWIKPWLDEEELYPGQDWNLEIEKAVEAADAILVCLSNHSITKEGYVQRELRIVLDYADYKPEGTLYIIPVRLEGCEPPRRLRAWQYADYFPKEGHDLALQRLLVSLKRRADSLGLKYSAPAVEIKKSSPEKLPFSLVAADRVSQSQFASPNSLTLSNGMEFMRVEAGRFLMGSANENFFVFGNERPRHVVSIPYDYWMARYPVTNELYNAYVKAKGIKHSVDGWRDSGKNDHPVFHLDWTDAMKYCRWLNNMLKSEMISRLVLRLPTEAEWERAARGEHGNEWPWGNEFDKNKCNSSGGGKNNTTPVGLYSPQGDSPYGCADMAGNVWEWTYSLFKPYPYKANDGREDEKASGPRVLRGGFFGSDRRSARCAFRYGTGINNLVDVIGFRVVAAPVISEVIDFG
jgi:formylglycine-generating enzyme required for sulfatase activity